jgi:hypothetical protein
MAFNPDHARRMRKAFQGSARVVQIGMQMISGPGFEKVLELATRNPSVSEILAFGDRLLYSVPPSARLPLARCRHRQSRSGARLTPQVGRGEGRDSVGVPIGRPR